MSKLLERNEGNLGMSGVLGARHIPGPHSNQRKQKVHRVNIPGYGPVAFTKDEGDAIQTAGKMFDTNLVAKHIRGRKVIDERDLGSGLVTNAGVNRMAEDWFWANGSNTLEIMLDMASGTGATAAAVGDVQLGTAASTTAVAGTQSTVQPNILQVVGTLSYGGSFAITEWGLIHDTLTSGQSFGSTGNVTFTGTSATTATVSGATWTVDAWKGYNVFVTSVPAMGVVLSNTATVLTVGRWNTPSTNVTATTPGNVAAQILPTLWDRKVFSAINVVNGDSIQFTYQLTITSGG